MAFVEEESQYSASKRSLISLRYFPSKTLIQNDLAVPHGPLWPNAAPFTPNNILLTKTSCRLWPGGFLRCQLFPLSDKPSIGGLPTRDCGFLFRFPPWKPFLGHLDVAHKNRRETTMKIAKPIFVGSYRRRRVTAFSIHAFFDLAARFHFRMQESNQWRLFLFFHVSEVPQKQNSTSGQRKTIWLIWLKFGQ